MVDLAGIFVCLIAQSAGGWTRYGYYAGLFLAVLSPAIVVWLVLRRNLRAFDRLFCALIRLAEDLGTVSTAGEVAAKLQSGLPALLPGASADLHVHDVASGTLRGVATKDRPEPGSIVLDGPV